MGNRASVTDKYKAAVESDGNLPPPTTFVHSPGQPLTIVAMKNEFHPFKVLYWCNAGTWPATLRNGTRKMRSDVCSSSMFIQRSRKVMFMNDDADFPIPHKSELHPYKLDFNSNIKNGHSVLVTKFKSTVTKLEPTKNRGVWFESDINPDPRKSELHPYAIDFGLNILSQDVIAKKKSEFVDSFLQGLNHVRSSTTHISIDNTVTDIREEPSKKNSWSNKKVHFSIWLCKEQSPRHHSRKSILKLTQCVTTGVLDDQRSEKQLHQSVVIASHIFWTLHEMKSSIQSHTLDNMERNESDDEDEGKKEVCTTAINDILSFKANEQHPMLLARLSPNAAILKDGCPPVGRLNKTPHISHGTGVPTYDIGRSPGVNTSMPPDVEVCNPVNDEMSKSIDDEIGNHGSDICTPTHGDFNKSVTNDINKTQNNEIKKPASDEICNHNNDEFASPVKDETCKTVTDMSKSVKDGITEMFDCNESDNDCNIPVDDEVNNEKGNPEKDQTCDDAHNEVGMAVNNGSRETLCESSSPKIEMTMENMLGPSRSNNKHEVDSKTMSDMETSYYTSESYKLPISTHKHLQSLKSEQHFIKNEEKGQHQQVLITMNDVVDKETIQGYFSQLLKNKFSFVIENVTAVGHSTECIIGFPSRGSARRFITTLNKLEAETGCSAKLQENMIDKKENAEYMKKEWSTLWKQAQSPLSSHQAKISKTERLISENKKRSVPYNSIDSTLEEIQALEQKLKEYKEQMDEYKQFLSAFEHEFNCIPTCVHVEQVVLKMKDQFSIERERLDACLPIYGHRSNMIEMVSSNQVSILLGETGSGKSTQMAQYLYEAGMSSSGLIACTQPRKVAATSLAKRVSEELHTRVGQLVGFKVGMQRKLSTNTSIVYMTDHMLLKECLDDPHLMQYSCIIVDEAHERSINTDLLLGMIKKCLPYRQDLRIIITSATIDPEIFVQYFGCSPILKVSGRVFPVDVFYSCVKLSPDSDFLEESVSKALAIAEQDDDGDILVFLTTPLETEKASEKAKQKWKGQRNTLISLALHGKTLGSDQQKVFDSTPKGKRKIVFATNSAETSITIPGIKYVVDTGLVKEKQYDPAKSMSALKVTSISKSSANQRKGRAGRTGIGKCYRLYTEEDYNAMQNSTKPEILRVHLGMAILDLLSLSIDDPLSFDFVEAPPHVALEKAVGVLAFLGAIENGALTNLGKKLSRLSLEPRLGKLVLRGIAEGIGYESVLLASFSTMGGNMFFRGGSDNDKESADRLKMRFCHFNGDFHTMLNVFKEWEAVPEKEKNKWCIDNSINAKSMRMTRDSMKEILNILNKDIGVNIRQRYYEHSLEADILIDRIVLEVYEMNVCQFTGHDRLGYFVVHDERILHIHPSSALKSLGKVPSLLVFENTLTTSRDFMINVTCITDDQNQFMTEKLKNSVELCKAKVVSPCVLQNIGESTLKTLIGKRYSVMKGLEKELKETLDTQLLTIEANVEGGTITVFAGEKFHSKAKMLLLEVIDREHDLMALEEIERPLAESIIGIRAIIGCGGGIKHLLFANEFRSIILRNVPACQTADSTMEIFREFGIIRDFYTNGQDEKKKRWVKVIFEHPVAARTALNAINDDYWDNITFTVKPEMTGAPSQGFGPVKPPEMQIKLTWCRRPLKGIGFVKFNEHRQPGGETIAETIAARMNTIYLGGMRHSRVSVGKKNREELFIGNVPKDGLQRNIVHRITETVENISGVQPSDVILIRENVEPSTQSDIQLHKNSIQDWIFNRSELEEDDIRIHIPIPRPKAFEYIAYVNIAPAVDIVEVERSLESLRIDGNSVDVRLMLKSSYVIQKDIYPFVCEDINDATEQIHDEINSSIDVKGKQFQNQTYILNIQTETFEDMAATRRILSKVLEGKTFELATEKHASYFKMKTGRSFLERQQKQNHVFIQIDCHRLMLHIYGRQRDTCITLKRITENVANMDEMHTKTFKVSEQYPPGMSKMLMAKYGIHLETMTDDTDLDYIDIKLRTHTLFVQGTTNAIAKTDELLSMFAEQLIDKAPELQKPDAPDCTVCFCPIEDGDIYRLESCGHAYCKECVKNMLHHSITDKAFPIICAEEGCRRKIVIKDIFVILGKSIKQLAPLMQGAVDKYILEHRKTLKYCVTPNCPMVYQVSDKMKVEVCGMCCVRICTKCHCQYHEGLTCERYQSMDTTDKETLIQWLAQDEANHALCPECGCGIEKDAGCMHMTCSMCKTHICWRCKATFKSSKETYDHLSAMCGGIF